MREILFRGKLKDNGDWIYWDMLAHITTHTGKISKYTQKTNYGEKYYHYAYQLWDRIDHSSIGQYTGLKDETGERIFEGDIISTDIQRPYLVVEFRDGCFMFNCNDGGKDYYDIMLPILEEPQTTYEYGEVIGNIHDNPELMEGGEGEG